jgi:hypothetical protein
MKDIFGRSAPQANINQRPYHDPYLVTQKAIAFKLDPYFAIVHLAHGCPSNGSYGGLGSTSGSTKTREIILSFQMNDGLHHRRNI